MNWAARGRKFLGISALLAGSTLFALLLCKIGLRLADISFPVFDTYDESRGVALRPGKEGWYRMEGGAHLRINSLGYRDTEHATRKPAGSFRVAVLGDSFVEARQVDLEKTFWRLLGSNLGACSALGGKPVEVLNFGVGGYATAEELLTLRRDVLRFSPDLILLGFFAGNDVHDNSKKLSMATTWRMRRPFYTFSGDTLVLERAFEASILQRLLYKGVHHLHILELVNEAQRAWTVRQIKRSGERASEHFDLGTATMIYGPPTDDVWRDAWRVSEALLAQMNREARDAGTNLAVFAVTMSEQVHPDPAVREAIAREPAVVDLFYPDRWLEDVGRRHGFPVVTLAQRMRAIAIRDGVYLHGFGNTVLGQGHWNETGHRIVGELLAADLCDRVLPPIIAGGGGRRP